MARKTPTFNLLIERYRKQLERLALGTEEAPEVARQARAMLLIAHGLAWKQVAQATGLSVCRVEHFRRRFVCLGLPGLSEAAPLPKSTKVPRVHFPRFDKIQSRAA